MSKDHVRYDESITVGSLIRTYHKGYHILTRIKFRDEQNPLFHYQKVLNENGTKAKSKEQHCDAIWCSIVTHQDLIDEQEALDRKHAAIKDFI